MQQLAIIVVKKNRKYFACTHNGNSVKLLLDAVSETLACGEHELLVEDVSVKTKFGTDVIFKMVGDSSKQQIVTLRSSVYNEWLVDACRKLGGRWDAEVSTWVFSSQVAGDVDELDRLYNEDLIEVTIEAKEDLSSYTSPVSFMGFTIARAFGRDSGARLGDNVMMLEGGVKSGGSVKNWQTIVVKGSRFRLEMSKNLLEKHVQAKGWKVLSKKKRGV